MRPARLHELWAPWAPLLAFSDAVAIYLCGYLAAWVLGKETVANIWPLPEALLILVLVGAGAMPLVLHAAGAYRPMRGRLLRHELRLVLFSWMGLFLLFAVFAFFSKTGAVFSRLWMAVWFFSALVALTATRVSLRKVLRNVRSHGLDVKDVILVGGGELAWHVREVLTFNTWTGLRIRGYFDDRERNPVGGDCVHLGSFADLPQYLDANRVDQIWLTLPLSAEEKIKTILDELKYRSIDVRLVPDVRSYQLLNHSVENIAGMPVLNLSLSPHIGLDRALKRTLDLVGGVVALVLFSPLMMVLAMALKLNDWHAPILFLQLRHGGDGKPFRVIKFRSMHVQPDSERAVAYQQASRHDSRVTRLGRWMRERNLDELPQLVNVLLGDMSLVGPRPHPVEMNRLYQSKVDRYMLRHRVRPGITGWAQVNGFRGETDTIEKMQRRIEHDLYYIENWSVWFDIKILLMTVFKSFRDPNAY